jgi:phage terminase large subunit-like protein
MMGGNRVGKTLTGAYWVTCHLTGIYPDWWTGKKFLNPTDLWCVGITSQSTRDIIQNELLGDVTHAIGTGMIPKHLIVGTRKLPGVPDGIDTIYVRHVSGGVSTCGLKSAEQGRGKFQGTARHGVWIDEEPDRDPYDIFSECRMRTMTVGGQVFITYTPLNGMNELGKYLLVDSTDDPSVRVTNVTWEDAPHLTEKDKAEMERSFLPHEIEARKNGVPVIKEGLVFPFTESAITCEPFHVPDHWPHIIGMDVGFTAATAAILLAKDPKTGIWYVIAEYAKERTQREDHATAMNNWGEGIYIACDPAANRSESDGRKTMRVYRELGLNIHNADNSVEAGISSMYEPQNLPQPQGLARRDPVLSVSQRRDPQDKGSPD